MGASKDAAKSSNSDKLLCVDNEDGWFLRLDKVGLPPTCIDIGTRRAVAAAGEPNMLPSKRYFCGKKTQLYTIPLPLGTQGKVAVF